MSFRKTAPWIVGLVTGAASSACSSGSDSDARPRCVPPSAEESDALTGSYEISEFVVSEPDCSVSGESLLADVPHFAYVRPKPALAGASPALLVGACDSAEACRAIAAGETVAGAIELFRVLEFSCSVGDGSSYGKSVYSGLPSASGACEGSSVNEAFLGFGPDGTLQLDTRTRLGDDYPAASGACSEARAERASANKPCTRYEAVRARKL